MIRLSVSSICYLRAVFPAECFSSRDYAGLKVHQIECAEKDENGETVVKNKDAFLLTQVPIFKSLELNFIVHLKY